MRILFVLQEQPLEWTHGSHQRIQNVFGALERLGVKCVYAAPGKETQPGDGFVRAVQARQVAVVEVPAPSVIWRTRALVSFRSAMALRCTNARVRMFPGEDATFDVAIWDGVGSASIRAGISSEVHLAWLQDSSALYWLRRYRIQERWLGRLRCLRSLAVGMNDEVHIRECDAALGIGELDALFLGATTPCPVRATGHGLAEHVRRMEPWMKDRQSNTVVFFGNLNYAPNEDAILWFARHVWPRIHKLQPQGRLLVCGRRPTWPVLALRSHPGIELYPDEPSIQEIVGSAWCAVAPLRFGAGVQNKVAEAVFLGTPCIASPVAVGGLPTWQQAGLVGVRPLEPGGWAEAVLDAWRQPHPGPEATRQARLWVETTLSWDGVAETLLRFVNELRASRGRRYPSVAEGTAR